MRFNFLLAAAAAAGLSLVSVGMVSAASAPAASATITSTSTGATNGYSLVLSDAATSPSPIGTFWFSWTPGKDFMATSPLSVVNPPGWTDNITHGGGSDGYAIQWVASSAAADVPAGGSLAGFSFTSADSPSSVFGNSVFFPTTPVLTTVAYDAGPFSDSGTTFVVTHAAVPEPATMALIAPVAMLLRRSRRRCK